MLNAKMLKLGTESSAIRQLFEYGKQRKAEIGNDKVYDFSIGNLAVSALRCLCQQDCSLDGSEGCKSYCILFFHCRHHVGLYSFFHIICIFQIQAYRSVK